MLFLNASSILSETIDQNHNLIPLINRFGLKLGLEDFTIEDICNASNINTEFFLTILNTYLNEDYFPKRTLQKFDIDLVIDYLKRTSTYIHQAQLYNLEKHLNAFIAMSDPENKQLELIRKMFVRLKSEMNHLSGQYMDDKEIPLALLHDLKLIFIKHLSGNYNENMCYAVIFSMDSLEKDLDKYNRIREKILLPKINELKKLGIDDIEEILAKEKSDKLKNIQAISQRELDVLRLVAQGYINKEVADKLNISLNTVLSHRKNISNKLGIKTVSGLIFYCISHGYLSADEIEL